MYCFDMTPKLKRNITLPWPWSVQTWFLSMSSCFSWSNFRNGNLKLQHVSCKVRNCNFVDSWHARNLSMQNPSRFFIHIVTLRADNVGMKQRCWASHCPVLKRYPGSWWDAVDIGSGFDDLRPPKNKGKKHEEWKYSQQFPLSQTSNEFKQKQQNRYITEPPLFPRLEGQQKTTTFGRNLDPTGELKHQQSCKKIPQKKNKITKTSIALCTKGSKHNKTNTIHVFT